MTESAGRTVSGVGHVTVRYWAAARAAAGVPATSAEPVRSAAMALMEASRVKAWRGRLIAYKGESPWCEMECRDPENGREDSAHMSDLSRQPERALSHKMTHMDHPS